MIETRLKRIHVLAFLTFLAFLTLLPDSSSCQFSTVRGVVVDKHGNPVENARITLLDPSRGTKYTVKSSKKGQFIKVGIIPSRYKIRVECEGYFPFELVQRIEIGKEEELKITLEKIPPRVEEDKDFTRGVELFKQSRYEEAVGSFKKAVERFPENVAALYNLAISCIRVGHLDEAIHHLEKAKELNPEAVDVYLALGECYFNKGENERALKTFAEAIAIEPENYRAYYNMGIIQYRGHRIEQAIQSFEKAIELDSSFASPYYQLGLAYVKKGSYVQAIQSFERFLQLEPESPEAEPVKEMIEKLKREEPDSAVWRPGRR